MPFTQPFCLWEMFSHLGHDCSFHSCRQWTALPSDERWIYLFQDHFVSAKGHTLEGMKVGLPRWWCPLSHPGL